jgi:hypothetical protein
LGLGADLGRSSEAEAGAADDVAMAFVGAALRVLRVAGAGAAAFFVTAAVLTLVVGGAGAGSPMYSASVLRSSRSVVWRVTTGMRFTRRSRRDCSEAHCASHCARSFSTRASISSRRLESTLAFASAVRPVMGHNVGMGSIVVM